MASGDPEPDDARLLNMVRAGDSAAYATLYQRHEQSARRLARELVAAPADADDVVAEAFARVLDVTRRGGGPTDAFRPYLLTALRRVCYDRLQGQRRLVPTGDQEMPDPGELFIDPAVASLDNSLIMRAFQSLPQRWSAVLWHTEIEQASPAEVAPLFGLSRNGVAALRHRAKEGLRQAYLQMHVSRVLRQECKPVAERLGAYIRDALSERDAATVTEHLARCDECRAVCAELTDVNATLRGLVAPVFLGGAAAAYLSGAGHGTAAAVAAGAARSAAGATAASGPTAAGAAGPAAASAHALGPTTATTGTTGSASTSSITAMASRLGRLRHPTRQQLWLAAGAGMAAAAVAAIALGVTLSGHTTALPTRSRPPHAAAVTSPPVVPKTPKPTQQRKLPTKDPTSQPGPSTASTYPQQVGSSQGASISVAPTPPPSRKPAAQLAATIEVDGNWPHGGSSILFEVTDTGTASTGELTASITLPSGTSLFGRGSYGPSGWTCQPTATGASCRHGPVSPGQSAQGALYISVYGRQACGQPVELAVSSGTLSASAQSGQDIQCDSGRFG